MSLVEDLAKLAPRDAVTSGRASTRQTVLLDDGEEVVLTQTLSWRETPAWPVIRQARPTVVHPPAGRPKKRAGRLKTAVILPDVQIGFRQMPDGTLDPFHDEQAMNVALQAACWLQPDLVVNLGDFLDLPGHGKYVQEPAWALTTQAAIDRAHLFLAEQVAAAPFAKIVLLEGNHDRRMQNDTMINAKGSFGLRQACRPADWPVLSLPFLLRMRDLAIDYIPGYPAGEFWINENVVCKHGSTHASGSSTAARVAARERVSQIFGHVHRIEQQSRTSRDFHGAYHALAATPGCLCRIDGAVPGVKGSTDLSGRPVRSYEDWQQGLAIVTYEEGNGSFELELVRIIDGRLIARGVEFVAKRKGA